MDPYQVTQKIPGSLHIEGLPDAVKLIRVDGPVARRVADLALHRSDLQFALACVDALEQLPPGEQDDLVKAALWRSAIVQYFKCFGDAGSRFQLNADKVYKDRPPEALTSFEFFRSMRNKHLVHDENAYMQCAVGAAINGGNKQFKIEKVLAIVHTYDVNNENNLKNLRLLVRHALEWVTAQFDECAALITRELEPLPYDALAARPAVQMRVPTIEDARRPR